MILCNVGQPVAYMPLAVNYLSGPLRIREAEEKARLQALASYAILDTPEEAEFDALTQLAAYICGAPVALISLLDAERQWFKSKVGLAIDQTPRDLSFCQYTIERNQLMEVTDALEDERFKHNPFVTDAPYIRYYCGVPLVTPEGYRIGTICVIDYVPRQLDDQQRQALRTLAGEVMARLELKRQQRVLLQEKQKLERSESRFRALFENAEGYLFTHDLLGNILSVNPAMAAALQYERTELVGKNQSALVPEEDRPAFGNYLQQVGEGQTVSGIGRIITKYGEEQFWLYRNFRYEDPLGEAYIIGSAHDVTDREIARQMLLAAKEKLESRVNERTAELAATNESLSETKAELDTFLYRASHDLKGPLCSLQGILQLAQMDCSGPQQMQYLTLMQETVQKLDHVLISLLNYSNNSRYTLTQTPVYFEEIIEQAMKHCQHIKGYEQVQLYYHIEQEVPLISDPERIKVILSSLFANSITFQNRAFFDPFIHITVQSNVDQTTISVADNGVGIEAEQLPGVFQMFSRSSTQSNGPGLGLYIVKEVLKKLGGTIEVQSTGGKGTTFYIHIPIRNQSEDLRRKKAYPGSTIQI